MNSSENTECRVLIPYMISSLGTDFYGERCERYKYASGCSEYEELGLREDSYCLLDSDGVGNLDPYTSICRLDENKMATIVNHNKRQMFDANQGIRTKQKLEFSCLDMCCSPCGRIPETSILS